MEYLSFLYLICILWSIVCVICILWSIVLICFGLANKWKQIINKEANKQTVLEQVYYEFVGKKYKKLLHKIIKRRNNELGLFNSSLIFAAFSCRTKSQRKRRKNMRRFYK